MIVMVMINDDANDDKGGIYEVGIWTRSLSGFRSTLYHLLALRPWAGHLASLTLRSFEN